MFVGTIHAYCLHMLQDHVPEFGNFDILDENRLAGLLSREYKRLELNKLGEQHWRPISDFLRNADVIENELIDPKRMAKTAFGECYVAYRADALPLSLPHLRPADLRGGQSPRQAGSFRAGPRPACVT